MAPAHRDGLAGWIMIPHFSFWLLLLLLFSQLFSSSHNTISIRVLRLHARSIILFLHKGKWVEHSPSEFWPRCGEEELPCLGRITVHTSKDLDEMTLREKRKMVVSKSSGYMHGRTMKIPLFRSTLPCQWISPVRTYCTRLTSDGSGFSAPKTHIDHAGA